MIKTAAASLLGVLIAVTSPATPSGHAHAPQTSLPTPASAPQTPPGPATSPAPVPPAAPARPSTLTWEQMRPHLAAGMAVAYEDQEHWRFIIEPPQADAAGGDPLLRSIGLQALEAAADDLAWLVGQVASARLILPGRTMSKGEIARLPDPYIDSFFRNPVFADPLRRFTDATLRAKGISCSDCLSGLRPSRDVTWAETRTYIKAFIYVKSVSVEGQVDLQIATIDNQVPELSFANSDLAGAVYAAMQATIREAPEFQRAVARALNAALPEVELDPPATIRTKLNRSLPDRVLQDRDALGPLLARLPQALERHGLRCPECRRVTVP